MSQASLPLRQLILFGELPVDVQGMMVMCKNSGRDDVAWQPHLARVLLSDSLNAAGQPTNACLETRHGLLNILPAAPHAC